MKLADAVYVMAEGKVVASGPFRSVEACLPAAAPAAVA
jgi:ABC-type branched-subunit amino acid transport system ATPase component